MDNVQALIPIFLVVFIVVFFFAKRKDKKVKTRIAWMLLVPCGVVVLVASQLLGAEDYMDAVMPFGAAVVICIVWLIALGTQK